jgi:hypothetical protein
MNPAVQIGKPTLQPGFILHVTPSTPGAALRFREPKLSLRKSIVTWWSGEPYLRAFPRNFPHTRQDDKSVMSQIRGSTHEVQRPVFYAITIIITP